MSVNVVEKKAAQLLARIDLGMQADRHRFRQRLKRITVTVSQRRDDIAAAIRDHQVVIVAGETGSGKTTQLPKICLGVGRGVAGFIGHTQPRRLAARSVATRIAEELATPLGEAVGYKVRFSDHSKKSSYIKLMTDGILLAELQGDRFLDQYDTLIIDEAHERSLNIDFLLGYLKQLLPKRPDLKLIITSATIDTQRFSEHFDNAPVIEVSGRSFPVEIRYHEVGEDEAEKDSSDALLSAIDELVQHDELMRKSHPQQQGDILIFLSGEREIRELAEDLRKHHSHNTEILPLYSRLSASEQNRVFQRGNKRRIVLATNVAETSITVPGIRYVIDPGKARISRYSYRSKVQRLPIEKIAQSSANQRAGRCGRLSDGICIRLYSAEDFQARPLFTPPEIQRTNLASVILQMRQLGLGDPSDFPFIDPPDQRFINDGFRLLLELGAIDEKRKLTAMGKQLARLPIDPRLGRMVLAAEKNSCLTEVLAIVSVLSVQDPRERPTDKQQQADEKHKRFRDEQSDFISLLNLWTEYNEHKRHLTQNKLRQYCKQEFLSFLRMKEWWETFSQLHTQAKGMGMKENTSPADYTAIHQSLLTGLLGNIGVKDEDVEKGKVKGRKSMPRYMGARNTAFHIFPGSGLAKKPPSWIMAAELVETSQLFARQNARIEPEWIESAAQHLVKRTYSEPHWNPKRGLVMADETVTIYGLVVHAMRRVNYGPIDPETARKIFIMEALVQGNYRTNAPFFSHNTELIEEARSHESKMRRQDVLVDDAVLFQFFDKKIPANVYSHVTFEQWRKQVESKSPDILQLSRADVFRSVLASSDENYPGEIVVNGISVQLKYCFSPGSDDDGVTAIIPVGSLNQFTKTQFDSIVPGFIEEKLTALLKGLPKNIRKQLVPIPEFVQSILSHGDELFNNSPDVRQDFLDVLCNIIKAEKNIEVKREDWRLELLPVHLLMRFEVVNHQNKSLGTGRSLSELQSRFGEQAAKEMAHVQTESAWPAEGLTSWQFGELPDFILVTRGEQEYRAYPAIIDKGDSVGIALFDSAERAIQSHAKGLRRLAMLSNHKAVKHLSKNIPRIESMCLVYMVFDECDELKDDLLDIILARCFFPAGYCVRTQAQFSTCMQRIGLLQTAANQVSQLVAEILERYQTVSQQFTNSKAQTNADIKQDIQAQLSGLVYAGFLKHIPFECLQEFPRYFRALSIRLEKLEDSPGGDEKKLSMLVPFIQEFERLRQSPEGTVNAEELTKLRWMLEEYRVSLFSQPMKTSFPISPKRIEKQISLCR